MLPEGWKAWPPGTSREIDVMVTSGEVGGLASWLFLYSITDWSPPVVTHKFPDESKTTCSAWPPSKMSSLGAGVPVRPSSALKRNLERLAVALVAYRQVAGLVKGEAERLVEVIA